MLLTDPPCGHPTCTCKQTWPTAIVTTANSIPGMTNGAVALQIGNHRYHLDVYSAISLLADLDAALAKARV